NGVAYRFANGFQVAFASRIIAMPITGLSDSIPFNPAASFAGPAEEVLRTQGLGIAHGTPWTGYNWAWDGGGAGLTVSVRIEAIGTQAARGGREGVLWAGRWL